MNHSPATHRRKQVRMLPRMISIGIGTLAVVALFVVWRGVRREYVYRQTIAVMGNPMHLVSFDAQLRKVVILDIPADIAIQATGGYGQYGVGALFALDHLERKQGSLFVGSVSDAFGVPVSWYVVPGEGADQAGSIEMVRSVFSWGSLMSLVSHRWDSSVPFFRWLSFVVAAQSLSADSVTIVHASGAFVPMALPDGSNVRALDVSRLDYLMGTDFLDSGIRAEGITVSVYNTTNIPSAGQHAARLMSTMGAQLVFVGNANERLDACEVRGSAGALSSKTGTFIREYFSCSAKAEEAEQDNAAASDLRVFLGEQYASQFRPSK